MITDKSYCAKQYDIEWGLWFPLVIFWNAIATCMFFHLLDIQLAGSRKPRNHLLLLFRELLDLASNSLRTLGDCLGSWLSWLLCEDGRTRLVQQAPWLLHPASWHRLLGNKLGLRGKLSCQWNSPKPRRLAICFSASAWECFKTGSPKPSTLERFV